MESALTRALQFILLAWRRALECIARELITQLATRPSVYGLVVVLFDSSNRSFAPESACCA